MFQPQLFNSRTHELLSTVFFFYRQCVKKGQRELSVKKWYTQWGICFPLWLSLQKKGWTKDLCEVTSFFFSPHENLIWCYSVAAAEGTTMGSGLHQLPPESQVVLFSFLTTFPLLLSTVSLKKSSLMMVAPHTNTAAQLREFFVSPGGERGALGEDWREARPWSKPLLWPHRDREQDIPGREPRDGWRK